jgi:hypothetical protein
LRSVNRLWSLGITGKLKAVTFDGTLAYLLMCEPPGVQVMCVTYSTNGLEAGDAVPFWWWLSPRRRKTNHARSRPRIALADNWPPVGSEILCCLAASPRDRHEIVTDAK